MILSTEETFRELRHQVGRNNAIQKENNSLRHTAKQLKDRIRELEKMVAYYERLEELRLLIKHQEQLDAEAQC